VVDHYRAATTRLADLDALGAHEIGWRMAMRRWLAGPQVTTIRHAGRWSSRPCGTPGHSSRPTSCGEWPRRSPARARSRRGHAAAPVARDRHSHRCVDAGRADRGSRRRLRVDLGAHPDPAEPAIGSAMPADHSG
jgi:hypothetical protein